MGAHPALIDAEELETFITAVEAGDTMTVAARKAGWSLNAIRNRIDRDEKLSERYALARSVGTHARADAVDQKIDEWIEDDKRSDSIRLAWARRWNPAYREKVELAGAFVPELKSSEASWDVNLESVLAIVAESGVKLTLEPAGEDASGDRSSGNIPGAALLPAPADRAPSGVPAE